MKGCKRSHLPTLSPRNINHARAVLAVALGLILTDARIPNIRAVLRCRTPEEVRRLLAKGHSILKRERASQGRKQ